MYSATAASNRYGRTIRGHYPYVATHQSIWTARSRAPGPRTELLRNVEYLKRAYGGFEAGFLGWPLAPNARGRAVAPRDETSMQCANHTQLAGFTATRSERSRPSLDPHLRGGQMAYTDDFRELIADARNAVDRLLDQSRHDAWFHPPPRGVWRDEPRVGIG